MRSGKRQFVHGKDSVRDYLTELMKKEILIFDGGMGTMIQLRKLDEEAYRGEEYKEWGCAVKGNNDLLSITQPGIIQEIHEGYLDAGAELIGTNTFSGTTIAQADYKMEDEVDKLNISSAECAVKACRAVEAKDPTKPRFVAGSVGPTNRTLSISPDVEDAGFRNIVEDGFDACRACAPDAFVWYALGALRLLERQLVLIGAADGREPV